MTIIIAPMMLKSSTKRINTYSINIFEKCYTIYNLSVTIDWCDIHIRRWWLSYKEINLPPKVKSVTENDNSHDCSHDDWEGLEHGYVDGPPQVQDPWIHGVTYQAVKNSLHIDHLDSHASRIYIKYGWKYRVWCKCNHMSGMKDLVIMV